MTEIEWTDAEDPAILAGPHRQEHRPMPTTKPRPDEHRAVCWDHNDCPGRAVCACPCHGHDEPACRYCGEPGGDCPHVCC